jgi:hypothetical protein
MNLLRESEAILKPEQGAKFVVTPGMYAGPGEKIWTGAVSLDTSVTETPGRQGTYGFCIFLCSS